MSFVQLSSALSKIGSGRTDVSLGAAFDGRGIDTFADDLRSVLDILKNKLDDLAIEVGQDLAERVAQRARENFNVGIIDSDTSWRQDEQVPAFESVLQAIRSSVTKIGPGRIGFASKRELDSIKIQQETAKSRKGRRLAFEEGRNPSKPQFRDTPSEFNIMWMIAEFGTGIYASPNKRTEGNYKLPGGGGAWVRNVQTMSPVLLGQKGAHFLFPTRQNLEDARDDLNFVREQVGTRIFSRLRGANG